MSLVINTRILSAHLTGVQRYLTEIMRYLPEGSYRTVQPDGEGQGLRGHVWEQGALPFKLKKGEMLWSPSNTGPLLVESQVVTLHDLATFDVPEGFSRGFRMVYQALLPRLLPRVRAVLTPSEFSRQRAIALFGLDPARVVATPLGVDHDRFKPLPHALMAEVKARLALPERYVLFVGSLNSRKNVGRLIEAWRMVQASVDDDIQLVLAGGAAAAHVFDGSALPVLPPRTVLTGRIDDADMPALLGGALAFAFPSLYEGFGLPPLEAMACGAPCIVSGAASLPEVVGDAARVVDPLQVDDIAAALRDVCGDAKLRAKMVKAGLVRAAAFRWETTAAATWNVLKEAVR